MVVIIGIMLAVIVPRAWLTSSSVPAVPSNSSIRADAFLWNAWSPTTRASSMRRMRGRTEVATAKWSRARIPDE